MTTWTDLVSLISGIVATATDLKDSHTDTQNAHVSYCAVFCQSAEEFDGLTRLVGETATLADNTATGPVYVTPVIPTKAGDLRVVKIRRPDETRKERGDADFAIEDYPSFKERYLGTSGFSLIERDEFEMIELIDPQVDVRVYFSHPPVEKHSGIREVLKGRTSDATQS